MGIFISNRSVGRTERNWRPTHINSETIKDWENGPTLVDYLNKLGDEGWELISEILDPRSYYEMKYALHTISAGLFGQFLDKTEEIQELLNVSGKNGWELVTLAPERRERGGFSNWFMIFKGFSRGGMLRLRFKRPKQENSLLQSSS